MGESASEPATASGHVKMSARRKARVLHQKSYAVGGARLARLEGRGEAFRQSRRGKEGSGCEEVRERERGRRGRPDARDPRAVERRGEAGSRIGHDHLRLIDRERRRHRREHRLLRAGAELADGGANSRDAEIESAGGRREAQPVKGDVVARHLAAHCAGREAGTCVDRDDGVAGQVAIVHAIGDVDRKEHGQVSRQRGGRRPGTLESNVAQAFRQAFGSHLQRRTGHLTATVEGCLSKDGGKEKTEGKNAQPSALEAGAHCAIVHSSRAK